MVTITMMIIRLYWLVVMSRREKVEEILSKAKEREKDYEWAKAAKLCKLALNAVGREVF